MKFLAILTIASLAFAAGWVTSKDYHEEKVNDLDEEDQNMLHI